MWWEDKDEGAGVLWDAIRDGEPRGCCVLGRLWTWMRAKAAGGTRAERDRGEGNRCNVIWVRPRQFVGRSRGADGHWCDFQCRWLCKLVLEHEMEWARQKSLGADSS